MPAIIIDGFDGDTPVGLGRVFALLPDRARSLAWSADTAFEPVPIPGIEVTVREVSACAHRGEPLPSQVLEALITANPQVIGGQIDGRLPGIGRLDFILRSVRGDEWDIEAADGAELRTVASRAGSWRPHPQPTI